MCVPVCQVKDSFIMRAQWAVVVALLVEWSIPIPEVRGSNPVIGKKLILNIYCQLYWKDENKAKRDREWPIFRKKTLFSCNLRL